MAKRKKLQDNNPPRRVEIRGQDHLLAYITPEEAQLLMDNGGAGEPGPMGIPAFFDVGEGMGGYGSGDADDATGGAGDPDAGIGGGGSTSGVGGGGGGGGNDSYDTISRATAKDYGTPEPTAEQIEQARGFDFGSDASDALIAQIQGGYGGSILGDKYAGSGIENQRFFDQLPGRLANAQANYGLSGPLSGIGALFGAIGTSQLNRMKNQVLGGGIPAFDATGKFQGVFSKGLFGGDVYTGMPIEGNELTGWSPDDNRGGDEPIKPVNPETGQCDAGYIFDEDLQACRLDTGGVASTATAGQTFAPGAYARMGLLDQTPQGLLQVAGQPYDFDTANRAFRMATATRPEYYSDPYDLQGYTLLA